MCKAGNSSVLHSIPFHPRLVFPHPFKSKVRHVIHLRLQRALARAAVGSTRQISDFLALSRSLNRGRFFEVPPTLASGSQIGIGARSVGFRVRWNSIGSNHLF
ncbi:hypothetical protein AVEN_33638-1 [Araneus ventricosus]|uniref:Uncharacterized protein n=1 Tax=Araneus ventricosus TaxID=182803 RepID=A0A4Y2SLB0_ARAVE|nr:hypothetical protein AVEN_148570-1 [Araneus ventricosus]GBN88815.1 hypothetical protein AVEN_271003-1 [Araneus ventricosus]GBN88877.1 hypothetical protein AVEN_94551-1 [Araneus ventricosus]GBN88881.1 hypothetical protein AVEN_33638-1 [Araneus ventricosus]